MTRRQKLIVSLITFVPVLVMIAVSGLHIRRQVRQLLRSANKLMEAELSRRWDREVRVGGAKVIPLGSAVVTDVAVAEGRQLSRGLLLSARRISIRYSLSDLLMGKGAQSVSRVSVTEPEVNLVRRPDGTFNVSELLKAPPGPPRPPFKGTITVTGGRGSFTDYLADTPMRPARNRFDNLEATFDASAYPLYSFRAAGLGEPDRLGKFRSVGTYHVGTKDIAVDLDAENISAAYWAAYHGMPAGVEVLGGKLKILAGVNLKHVGKRTRVSYTGAAWADNVSVRVPHLSQPLRQISGSVVFAGDKAALDLRLALTGPPARLTGFVSNFEAPSLNIVVSAPAPDYGGLIRAIDLPRELAELRVVGSGPARAQITGRLAAPTVEFTARVPRVSVQGLTASDLRLSGSYSAGRVAVRSASFASLGAAVRASGTVDLSGVPRLALRGNVRRLHLATVPKPEDISVTGTADADFSVAGTLREPAVAAIARIPAGSVDGVAFQSLEAQFETAGKKLKLANLTVGDVSGGVVKAAGEISSQALALDVSAEGMDVGKLAGQLGQPDYEGIGYFRGRIAGTPRVPTASGTFEVFRGRYREYDFDYARAGVDWDGRVLDLQDAIVRIPPAEIAFSGDVTPRPGGRLAFNASGRLERLRAERIMLMLGRPPDIGGTLSGEFNTSGVYLTRPPPKGPRVVDLMASGRLSLQDGTAFALPIDSASAQVKLAEGKIDIADAVFTSQSARLSASGTAVLEDKTMDLSFGLADFELSRLQDQLTKYVAVSGLASAEGTATGRWDSPSISAAGSVTRPILNRKAFDSADFKMSYANGLVQTWQAGLKRGSSLYALEGVGYNPKTLCLTSATARLDQVAARDVWDMFRNSPFLATEEAQPLRERVQSLPRITSGTINGTLQLSGCLKRPDGSLVASATNVGIDVQEIESINVTASSQAGVVKLDEFLAVSQDLNMRATGDPLYQDNRLHLEFTAQNLDLLRLRPWLGEHTPGGLMSVEFVVDGDVSALTTYGSVEVVDPTYRGMRFERFRASTIELFGDRLELSDLILAARSHQAVASGYLPWSWKEVSVPTDKPLELSAKLDEQDLSLLGVFTPLVDESKTKGPVRAELRVQGSIANPKLSGELKIVDGTIALKNFTNEFTGVRVDLAFDGDRVLVNEMSADSSAGGKIGVDPGGYVAVGERTEANLLLFAEKLVVGERNLLGFSEDVLMQVDAGVGITGDVLKPLLADSPVKGTEGGVTISNAKLEFAFPEKMPEHEPQVYAIDPTFNLTLRLGDKVAIEPPMMSLQVTDRRGSLLGTLSQPNLTLELEIQEGVLRLAGARVRVVPGGRINITYAPPTVMAVVELQATTSMLARSRFGRVERYQVVLSVRGPVSDLRIDLSSRPAGLSREQMLAALGHVEGLFASAESELRQDVASILSAVGTTTLFGPIESLFVEKLGFEQFSLEYNVETPLSVYVTRRLFGNFYVAYYQRLATGFASAQPMNYQFTFSYRFRRQYEFSVSVDDQQTIIAEAALTRMFN